MKTYSVKEIFGTLQGEGAQSGTPAVFLRFGGCNAWSGRPEDRAQDKGRTSAGCAAWCDTDFFGGEPYLLGPLLERVLDVADDMIARPPLVVCTGGEPTLQLDTELVEALQREGFRVAIETNGSREDIPDVDWICVSPKFLDDRWKLRAGDELKVIYPAVDPEDVLALIPTPYSKAFDHYFVQPLDEWGRKEEHAAAAVEYVKQHPFWRLSTQTHKVLGLR